jgi:diketogulonate reductase-like aldo/keto reductase
MPPSAPRAAALLCAAALASAAPYSGPRMQLGTGGGGGGFDAPAWIAAGGTAFNMALAYCYAQFSPQCSQVTVANAVADAKLAGAFLATKIEPEDFSAQLSRIWGSGSSPTVSRDVLQEMNVAKVDVLMWHQAGRAQGASNFIPECFNASAAGPDGPGAYSACRVLGHKQLLAVQKAGGATTVGVSNYPVRDLQQLFDATGVWPEVLEIEMHPYWHEDALIDFAVARNITILAYAPLAKGAMGPGLLQDPAVAKVAAAHGVTPAQAVLKWGLQRAGGVVLPRSTNPAHMRDNLAVLGMAWSLSDAEMAALAALPQKKLYNTACFPWC